MRISAHFLFRNPVGSEAEPVRARDRPLRCLWNVSSKWDKSGLMSAVRPSRLDLLLQDQTVSVEPGEMVDIFGDISMTVTAARSCLVLKVTIASSLGRLSIEGYHRG